MILLQVSNKDDKIGYIGWRPAFYVAGSPDSSPVKNFLTLLDLFFIYKSKLLARRRLSPAF